MSHAFIATAFNDAMSPNVRLEAEGNSIKEVVKRHSNGRNLLPTKTKDSLFISMKMNINRNKII